MLPRFPTGANPNNFVIAQTENFGVVWTVHFQGVLYGNDLTKVDNLAYNSDFVVGEVNCNAVVPVLSTSVTNVTPGCANGSINLTATGNYGPYSYAWSNGNTAQNISGLAAGIYTVTVTAVGVCPITATATVVQPTVTATSNATVGICAGTTLNLKATGGATYSWTGPGFTSTQQNPVISNVTAAMAGTYIVTVTKGCGITTTSSASTLVKINDIPVPIATSTTPSLCSGAKTAIALTSSLASSTFSYSPTVSGGLVSGDVSGAGVSIAQALVNNGTTPALVTYSILATKSGCISSPIYTSVLINPKPTGVAAPAPVALCSGSRPGITLTPGAVSGTSFTWTYTLVGTATETGAFCTTPGGFCGTYINDLLYNAGTATGTVTFNITPWANGCSGTTFPAAVTVAPIPVATSTPSVTVLCSGLKTNLAFTSTTGTKSVFTYTTSMATSPFGGTINGFASGIGAKVTQLLTNTGTTPGIVSYTIVPSFLGCVGSPVTATVTVNPVATGIAAPLPEAICSGSATGITIVPGAVQGTTFTWTAVPGGAITGASTCVASCLPAINDVLTNSGFAAATVAYSIVPWANGCAGTKITDVVTVTPIPVASVNATSSSICNGGKTNILLTATTGSKTVFTFTAAITTPADNGTVNSFSGGLGAKITQLLTNTGTTPGVVTYSITPSLSGCSGPSITSTVTVNPVATGSYAPLAESICSGSATGITLAAGPVSGTTFTWTSVSAATVTGASANVSGTSINDVLSNTGTATALATYSIIPWANGCAGTKITDAVSVKPIPIAYSTSPAATSVCNNAKTNIPLKSFTAATILSYTASVTSNPGGGTINGFSGGSGMAIGETLTNSGTSPGVVSYIVTPNYLGCVGSPVTFTVTVNPVANVYATAEGICSGASAGVTLNSGKINGSGIVANTVFTWSHSAVAVTGATNCTTPDGSCTSTISDILTTTAASVVEVYTITPWANGCAGTPYIEDVTVQGHIAPA